MRAITVNEYGARPALTEVPDPEPGSDQVLIKVRAAGVNPIDRTIADGALKEMMPASFPLILGSDLAGVVEAVGEEATRFTRGDEVFGLLMIPPLGSTGTYAEHVAVGEDAPLARVPKGLDPVVAAALPGAGATALAIVESPETLSGETVLPVGVGSFATQLAANAGAHVIAVARPSANDRVRTYGAAETVDPYGGLGARCRGADASRRDRHPHRPGERRRRLRRPCIPRSPRRHGGDDPLRRRYRGARLARGDRIEFPSRGVELAVLGAGEPQRGFVHRARE